MAAQRSNLQGYGASAVRTGSNTEVVRDQTNVDEELQTLISDRDDASVTSNPFKAWNNFWSKPYVRSSSVASDLNEQDSFYDSRTESVASEQTLFEERWTRAKESQRLQPFLFCSALCALGLVIMLGATATEKGLDKAAGRPILRNMGTAAFCFGVSDVIAQVIQHQGNVRESFRELQGGRSARASLLGMFVNGVGYSVWLYFLDKLIPQHDVGLHNVSFAMTLIAKGCVDSYIWGILSNSVGIVGRRMLEGDTQSEALRVWNSKIVSVTIMDFQFWPLWAIINFQVIPKKLQVSFVALGAIIWNVYISLVSNWEMTVHPHPVAAHTNSKSPVTHAKQTFRSGAMGHEIPPHVNEHDSHPEFKLPKWKREKRERERDAAGADGPVAPGVEQRGYQVL